MGSLPCAEETKQVVLEVTYTCQGKTRTVYFGWLFIFKIIHSNVIINNNHLAVIITCLTSLRTSVNIWASGDSKLDQLVKIQTCVYFFL